MAERPDSGETLAVGLYLGSANRIASMKYLKTWGWVARDTTGVEYAQRAPRNPGPMRVVVPDGLRASVQPVGASTSPRRPWPPAPHFGSSAQGVGE